jgi:uncharacterized protein (TIGR03000 family)
MTTLRLALAGVALAVAAASAACGEEPICLRVLVPADAAVEIEGKPTQSVGESGRYVTPPLGAGKTYAYTFKVTSRRQPAAGRRLPDLGGGRRGQAVQRGQQAGGEEGVVMLSAETAGGILRPGPFPSTADIS